MSEAPDKPGKNPRRDSAKPALTCAICKRRYRDVQTPGLPSIYGICPDCRTTGGAQPATGDKG